MDPVTLGGIFSLGGKLLERLFPDPEKRAAAQLELEKMKESGELARMANDTELAKAFLGDMQSARDREAKIVSAQDAPKLNKIITPLLACVIVVLSFVIFGFLLFGGEIPVSRKDVIIYLLGILSAALLQVLNYYFGTSQGSTHASQLFRDIVRKQG